MVQSYPQNQPQGQPQYIQQGAGSYVNPIQPVPQRQPVSAVDYSQPLNNYAAQPQQAATNYGQPVQNPYTAGGYIPYTNTSQATTPQTPSTNTSVSYAAPSQEDGEIKVINGVRYREVKETRNEVNELGQNVRKIIVKLQPFDDGVKVGSPIGAPVSAGYSVNPGATYVNAPANYIRQSPALGSQQPAYSGNVVYR